MRFFGLAAVVGIIGIAGAAGAITLRDGAPGNATETSGGNVTLHQEGRSKSALPRSPRPFTPTPTRAVVPTVADEPTATPATAVATPAAAPVEPLTTPDATPPAPKAAIGPLLGEGRTSLTDSIFAMRTGDAVVVNFDTQGSRTRRADKFEQMLRLTLPLVYGRRITATLDSVPTGSLLPSRDLLGSLASQGVHLTLENGLRIGLWPQTRETSDGPLVVAYRVVVER